MPSVPAHTNKPGNHSVFESRTNTQVGVGNTGNPVNDKTPVTFMTKFSAKSHPTPKSEILPGFLAPKEYYRDISRVVDVQPERVHLFSTNKRDDKTDVIRDTHHVFFHCERPDFDSGQTRANLRAESDTCALLRLRQGNRLQLGADIGESRKTLNMIGGNMHQVLSAYRAARRGNWVLAARILGLGNGPITKQAANRWLELQYGWLPLMGSIHDGVGALREGFRDPSSHIYSAKCVKRISKEKDLSDPGRTAKTTHQWISKSQIYYKVSNRVVDQIDRFGLLNPLSVAWELVPFSFVLDWFVPVGNTLSALTATAGLEFVAGYHTMVELKTFEQSVIRNPSPGVNQISPGRYATESFGFQRGPWNNFPRPQLYASSHPLSTKRVVNAIALLRQLL